MKKGEEGIGHRGARPGPAEPGPGTRSLLGLDPGRGKDGDRLAGDVPMPALGAGRDGGDRVHDIHARDDLAEHGVAELLGIALGWWSRKALSTRLMKNWQVALSISGRPGHGQRAPQCSSGRSPASFLMGGLADFSCMSAVIPPPWTMKPLMTRWKMVPS